MSIETLEELRRLRAAGRAVARVLAEMRRRVAPGTTTAALDAVAAETMAALGARSAPRLVYGFPGATCVSVNDEAAHGVPGGRVLRDGDLVTLDVTVELDELMADAAVTVPVGAIGERDRALCRASRAALAHGLAAARSGGRASEIGAAVEREVERRGFRVLRELTGHGIGRSIHEPPTVPNHAARWLDAPLTEGLVITVEPIVAETRAVRQGADGWTVLTADGSRAAQFEHTVVVRRGRPLLLTV